LIFNFDATKNAIDCDYRRADEMMTT